jgi:hypothetical protein
VPLEEIRHETVRILKASRKSKYNLVSAEVSTFLALKTNAELKVLPADRGYLTVFPYISGYNRKFVTF